jgi:hypothetical protein
MVVVQRHGSCNTATCCTEIHICIVFCSMSMLLSKKWICSCPTILHLFLKKRSFTVYIQNCNPIRSYTTALQPGNRALWWITFLARILGRFRNIWANAWSGHVALVNSWNEGKLRWQTADRSKPPDDNKVGHKRLFLNSKVSRDFRLWLHQTSSPDPNRLDKKRFRYFSNIRRVFNC